MFGKYIKSQILITAVAFTCTALPIAFTGGSLVQDTSAAPDRAALVKMTARFAPVDIAADVARLSDGDRKALARLVEAARIIDALFLRQVWAGNDAMLQDLAAGDPQPIRPQ